MSARRGIGFALLIAVILIGGRVGAGAFSDYQWFAALDATEAWRVQVLNRLVLHGLAFLLGTAIALLNLWIIRRSVAAVILPRRIGDLEIGEEVPAPLLSGLVLLGAVVLGALFAIPATDWTSFVLAQSGAAVGEVDPYVRADLGVWLFWFPFEHALHRWFSFVIAVTTTVVLACYALTPALRFRRGQFHVSPWVRRHIALLAAATLLVIAWRFRLDAFDLLVSGTAPGAAFGAADLRFGLPVATILAYASGAAAFVVGWAGWSGQPRLAVAVLSIMLLLTPTLRWIVPSVVAWTDTAAEPADRERPFDVVRAGFTRRAFGLDRIRRLPDSLAIDSVVEGAGVPVWDPTVITRIVGRTQPHGGLIGTMPIAVGGSGPAILTIAAPPPGDGSTPPSASWRGLRVLGATTDGRGGLVFVDRDGHALDADESLGAAVVWDGARGAAIVRDTSGRIAGARLDRLSHRIAEAWSQQDLRLLGAGAADSRLVRRRDVRERVRALVPFMVQGTTVTPIIDRDSLVWSLELFSASRSFPLSRPLSTPDGPVRYLAHAATALVAASTGRVTIVPVGEADADPVLRAWMRRLPRTLGAVRTMTRSIAVQLPPVWSGAEWQGEAFAAVGLRGEAGRRRHIPALDGSDTLLASRHPTPLWWSRLSAGAWTQPFVDSTDRIAGLLVATGGAERALYWYPTAGEAARWMTVLDSLRALAVTDREAVAGRVRAIPMAGGRVLLIQPTFEWPLEGVPRLRAVAVASDGRGRVAPTLAAAVGSAALVGPTPAAPANIPEQARTLYDRMHAALQRGDWVAFGDAFEALGQLLERARR